MIRVGLLGAAHGHVGYALTEARLTEDVTIVAAAERDPAARAAHLAELTIPITDDPLGVLDQVELDVAVVCGIFSERAEVVVECLRRGIPVLADKPLCTTLDQWERIRSAAVGGPHLALMFDKRFYPETTVARRLLADGVLGELAMVTSSGPHKLLRAQRPDWFLHRDTYGGIANDLPTHDIDLVLALSGARRGTVAAATGQVRCPDLPGFDDHVAVLLSTDTVTAAIDADWMHPEASDVHGHYRMRLIGTEGTAEIDWAYHQVAVTTHDRARWQEPLPAKPRPVQFFFDALRSGTTPAVTTQDSLRVTKLALLGQRSADLGSQESFDFAADGL